MKHGLNINASYARRIVLNLLLFTGFFCFEAKGQSKLILSPGSFISQVKQYHPLSRQANILVEQASAALLAARGNFDPLVSMNQDDKAFSGINYYRYTNLELKLPTVTGIAIKSGFENTGGSFANPELSRGIASYLGVEIPLLQGLLADKQRTVLQQAKTYKKLAKQEQANVINDLLFDAYNAYWHWAAAYQLHSLYSRYLELTQKRVNLVRLSFFNGDRSVADTLEAHGQLQNFSMLQNEAAILLNARYYELSLFLWDQEEKPYLLSDLYTPDLDSFNTTRSLPTLDSLENELALAHPALSAYVAKQHILEAERRLKFQNLLPLVNFKANLLSKEYFKKLSLDNSYLANNYKFGFSIKTPLFFRQAKGEYRTAKLKIKDNNYQLARKRWELQTKLRKYYNEALLYEKQLRTANEARSNYATLLKLEEMKLMQGESSLFLVNARENKLLEVEEKLIELRLKYLKAFYAMDWSAGHLR
jgi:outer membrane protein TolC